jgi:cytochrome c biogenesis protein ResB
MKKIFNFLSSLNFFIILIILLILLLIIDSFCYGKKDFINSLPFTILAISLFINILLCIINKIILGKRYKIYFYLIHIGVLILISGFILSSLFYFEGEMQLEKGQQNNIVNSKGELYKIPFSIILNNFEIKYYKKPELILCFDNGIEKIINENDVIKYRNYDIKILKIYNDFAVIGKNKYVNKSLLWNNPAIEIFITNKENNEQTKNLVFLNFKPNINLPIFLKIANNEIDEFISDVTIIYNDIKQRSVIKVNKPVNFKGYKIYQEDYDPQNANITILKIKKDNFLWVIYTGFLILIIGVVKWII